MKIMVCSDIHGSFKYAETIKNIFDAEQADKLVILGDLYYHGPRNPLPDEYDPKKVAEIFNNIKQHLIVIQGNCDSEVDQMISEFAFVKQAVLTLGSKTIFASHGHVFNKDSRPAGLYDVVLYGHFHKAFIEKCDGIFFVNPGSVSLPKDGVRAYITLTDEQISLKDIDGNVIDAQQF